MVNAPADTSVNDSRKAERSTVQRPGWIALGKGTKLLECTVWDESETGARLVIQGAGHAPDEFYLYLSLDFMSRRRCRVAWRSEQQIGVEYVPEPARAHRRASDVPESPA
jgi:hypothetical protein